MPPEKPPTNSQTPDRKKDESTFKTPNKTPSKDLDTNTKIHQSQRRVREKQEILRKLKLVKMYRTKWETQSLDKVTTRWLRACQEALEDLRVKVRERNIIDTGEVELTLRSLVGHLGIDPQVVQLDQTEDCFDTSNRDKGFIGFPDQETPGN
ncbi:swi5-dependent recombination DNA repair protein 1 homolog [Homarus americanus]|uniref:swi5-dependent recombination DNA repair protein 1 homolog n=1 Tax=Homarus americanus TaxID=6706 RepID=UPI001C48DE62|nr:swi5-dependent recombination DNA repair protein 1 homolog [Homarus americanus]XP_042221436.1 swi5-dependent recombination DNA repair protein 1 homolog [Homarus americanus]XP_042221437.1 swi5-dependent recombination DNA repair protein 1 homolog [Homarus americanus]